MRSTQFRSGILSSILLLFVVSVIGEADGRRRRRRRKRIKRTEIQIPVKPQFLPDPRFGHPVYTGSKEGSGRLLDAMGLLSFPNYRIGIFFTNDRAKKVAEFYVKAFAKFPRKMKNDEELKYTFQTCNPSDRNPLGNKVVITEKKSGYLDIKKKLWNTLIAIYYRYPKNPNERLAEKLRLFLTKKSLEDQKSIQSVLVQPNGHGNRAVINYNSKLDIDRFPEKKFKQLYQERFMKYVKMMGMLILPKDLTALRVVDQRTGTAAEIEIARSRKLLRLSRKGARRFLERHTKFLQRP